MTVNADVDVNSY